MANRVDGTENGIAGRRWPYYFAWNGKLREMGLVGFPEVPLAEARKAHDAAKQNVRAGVDPIAAREAAKRAIASKSTFGERSLTGSLRPRNPSCATTSTRRSGVSLSMWTPRRLEVGRSMRSTQKRS